MELVALATRGTQVDTYAPSPSHKLKKTLYGLCTNAEASAVAEQVLVDSFRLTLIISCFIYRRFEHNSANYRKKIKYCHCVGLVYSKAE